MQVSLDLLSVYKPSWFGCSDSQGGSEYLFPCISDSAPNTVVILGNEKGEGAWLDMASVPHCLRASGCLHFLLSTHV